MNFNNFPKNQLPNGSMATLGMMYHARGGLVWGQVRGGVIWSQGGLHQGVCMTYCMHILQHKSTQTSDTLLLAVTTTLSVAKSLHATLSIRQTLFANRRPCNHVWTNSMCISATEFISYHWYLICKFKL